MDSGSLRFYTSAQASLSSLLAASQIFVTIIRPWKSCTRPPSDRLHRLRYVNAIFILSQLAPEPIVLRADMHEQGEEVCKKIGAYKYLECSAKTNTGVREVFETATRAALLTKKRKDKKCLIL
jgi:Ras family